MKLQTIDSKKPLKIISVGLRELLNVSQEMFHIYSGKL